MDELFDIYDENRNFLGRSEKRTSYIFKKGEYHVVTDAFIFNNNGQLLLTRRAPNKKGGLLWEGTGGSVLAGEKSNDAIIREIGEEIGLKVSKEELLFYKTIKRDEEKSPRFKDLWIIKKDINIKDLVFQAEEVIDAKWVGLNEYVEMQNNNQIVETIDFHEEDYKQAIKMLNIGE